MLGSTGSITSGVGKSEGLLTTLIAKVAAAGGGGSPVSRWTPNFSKLVDRLVKSPVDHQGPLLVQMEEWLVPAKFENTCHQAQMDLLQLWDCSLNFTNERVAQQLHREVVSL